MDGKTPDYGCGNGNCFHVDVIIGIFALMSLNVAGYLC